MTKKLRTVYTISLDAVFCDPSNTRQGASMVAGGVKVALRRSWGSK